MRGEAAKKQAEADTATSVSVVIVNFNAGEYLPLAVSSVLDQSASVDEIVVVNNDSHDSSLASLRERCPSRKVKVIPLNRNEGFAHACNAGIQATASENVLLLNPDCWMFPGALKELLRVLHDDPNVAMVGPLLLNPDGTEQRGGRRDIPNPWHIFCYMLGLHRLMPRHPRFRSFNKATDPLPQMPVVVPAISGACMLIRRSLIAEIGGMDSERYFLHFEDLDLCLRTAQTGRAIIFAPNAIVEHSQGVCSASRPLFVEYHKHRSLDKFLASHFSRFYPAPFMGAVRILIYLHLLGRFIRGALLSWHSVPRVPSRRIAPALAGSANEADRS